MSRYHQIDTCNMVNGEGIRTVIWLSGCPFHCKACFNPTTWNPQGGKEVTSFVIQDVLRGVESPYCDGLTLLGGEPLTPYNVEVSTCMARETKRMGKTVWCYTGFAYEQVKDLEIMQYIDVLIDGRFILSQFNPNLKWRGSANQRVIDVQVSREQGEVVLHPDNNFVDKYQPELAFNPCEGMTNEEIKEKYIDNVCDEGLN